MTVLCHIPRCALRGRHKPDCPDPDGDCRGCLPRATEVGYTCDRHDEWARADLGSIIQTAPDARLVGAGLARIGSPGASGKPQSRLPFNAEAMDTLHDVQNRLTTLAREVADIRGMRVPHAGARDPIVVASRWLLTHLEWMRHALDAQYQPFAIEAYAEIRDCASRIRGILDGPAAQKYLGPCGAVTMLTDPTDDEFEYESEPCEGDVYARPNADKGRCRSCGAQYDQADRRLWLDEQAGATDLAWTALGIADALGLNVKTVRSWATERRTPNGVILQRAKLGTFWRNTDGRLVPWVDPDPQLPEAQRAAELKARGDRLHYVADVMALAREAAERRAAEEARRNEQGDAA